MNITRPQLVGFGCTKHQAVELTKSMNVAGKQNRCNLYCIAEILDVIAVRISQPRIRKTTRAALQQIHETLTGLNRNIISIPFGAPQTEATEAVKQLLKSASNPKLLTHKMKAAELKGKRLTHAG
jgi:hypothetical protein